MKTVLIIFLVIMFVLTGCGNDENSISTDNESTSPTAAVATNGIVEGETSGSDVLPEDQQVEESQEILPEPRLTDEQILEQYPDNLDAALAELDYVENLEAEQGSSTVKEIEMTAKQWEFSPSIVEVNKGDTVRLRVTSIDVAHGIYIPEFNLNKVLEPGKTVTLEFVADTIGEFDFICSVQCGTGHSGMNGKLIVR